VGFVVGPTAGFKGVVPGKEPGVLFVSVGSRNAKELATGTKLMAPELPVKVNAPVPVTAIVAMTGPVEGAPRRFTMLKWRVPPLIPGATIGTPTKVTELVPVTVP